MRVYDVAEHFICGGTSGSASGKRLRIEGNDLVNYSTVIATRDANDEILLNGEWYSRSTTKHQNVIRRQSIYREVATENEFNEIRKEIIRNRKVV